MSNYLKMIGGGFLIAVLFFFIGRETSPEKTVVKTVKEIVTVESTASKEQNSTAESKDKMYIKIVRKLPDGTEEVETKVVDKGTITIEGSKENSSESYSQIKELAEHRVEKWRVSLMVGTPVTDISFKGASLSPNYIYGLKIDRKLIGPLSVGAYGYSDRHLGLSIGVDF